MINIKKRLSSIPIELKASSAYVICNILQKCLSFITMPLFTRLLTKEQYGQYTIYSSWSAILSIFITLNLAYGSFQAAMVKFKDQRNEYISSVQGICLTLSLIVILIFSLFNDLFVKILQLPMPLIYLMIAEIICNTSILLWSSKQRFEYKYKSVIFITLLVSFLAPLLAFLLVLNNDEKGYCRIIGYASANIIFGGIIFIYNIIKGKKLFDKKFWKYALGFNVPLIVYYLSQMIFMQSDRIMINNIHGTGDAAMYGVAYNLAMILSFVLNAINNSYIPWLYKKIQSGKQTENKPVACGIAVLIALMLLCVVWYAPEIISIMAGENYLEAVPVVAPVSICMLLQYYCQMFINFEFYYEDKGSLVYASVLAAVVNVFLNYVFIPTFGFVAAGYTTLISYFLFTFCNYIAMKIMLKKRNIQDNAYDYFKMISILCLFIFVSFAGTLLYDYLVIRIIITAVVFFIILHFRKLFLNIFKTIKK